MIRGVLTVMALGSLVAFPWPYTAALALVACVVEPLLPLALGILADTLYYTRGAQSFPIFTVCGTVVTLLVLLVQSRLRAGAGRDL